MSPCLTLLRTIVLVFCFAVAPVFAQGFTFAEIPWGANVQDVTKLLGAKGFTTTGIDKDGDLPFRGQLLGYKAIGLGLFSGGSLQKMSVILITPDNKARQVYRDLKDTLVAKYGPPTNNFEFFERPYYAGDGFEEQAIRLSKGHFTALWKADLGVLAIEITERLTVRVAYEGPEWAAEADRRKARARSVF